MLWWLLVFLGCAAVIVAAGIELTRSADALAELTGLGRLLVGSILLAAATSLPELVVDVSAVRNGAIDLAVGNVFGACLVNLLVLAMVDLTTKARGKMFSRAAAGHALSATKSIAMTTMAALALALAPRWRDLPLPVDPGIVAIALMYLFGLRLVYFDQQAARTERAAALAVTEVGMTIRRAIVGYLVGAAAILAAGPVLAVAADHLSEQTGLGRTFVGTTLVAVATTLPESVATMTAARTGAIDLAIGNILGSNSFNMLLLVPLGLVSPEPLLASASPTHLVTALASILATCVAVLGLLYNVEKRRSFLEPDAALVLAVVVSAMALVYCMR